MVSHTPCPMLFYSLCDCSPGCSGSSSLLHLLTICLLLRFISAEPSTQDDDSVTLFSKLKSDPHYSVFMNHFPSGIAVPSTPRDPAQEHVYQLRNNRDWTTLTTARTSVTSARGNSSHLNWLPVSNVRVS